MSEMERLEERLRAFGAAPDAGADWEDVLRRTGGRLSARRFDGRRLALALAAAVVVAASVVGVLVTRGTPPGPTGSKGVHGIRDRLSGPTGATGTVLRTCCSGPTGLQGPTGRVIQVVSPGYTGPTGNLGPTGVIVSTLSIPPLLMTPSELKGESEILGTPIYWAGSRNEGEGYEFSRNGGVYVRYLPKGIPAGDPGTGRGAPRLIVATYPVPGAFAALTKQSEGNAVAGPNGSIIYVNPNDPKSVYVAFPNVDYQIEIYDPSPAVALATAKSGHIRPAG